MYENTTNSFYLFFHENIFQFHHYKLTDRVVLGVETNSDKKIKNKNNNRKKKKKEQKKGTLNYVNIFIFVRI